MKKAIKKFLEAFHIAAFAEAGMFEYARQLLRNKKKPTKKSFEKKESQQIVNLNKK